MPDGEAGLVVVVAQVAATPTGSSRAERTWGASHRRSGGGAEDGHALGGEPGDVEAAPVLRPQDEPGTLTDRRGPDDPAAVGLQGGDGTAELVDRVDVPPVGRP